MHVVGHQRSYLAGEGLSSRSQQPAVPRATHLPCTRKTVENISTALAIYTAIFCPCSTD